MDYLAWEVRGEIDRPALALGLGQYGQQAVLRIGDPAFSPAD